MPRIDLVAIGSALRIALIVSCGLAVGGRVYAQEPSPPAYLAVVEGVATLERNGESEPAVRDMPFVEGDRLRTENGRVEIAFPDGTAIEVGPDSLVEAVTATRVRLLAGSMEHLQRASPGAAPSQPADSAPYLPSDLQVYGSTFDRYGSWQYAAPYGYVWYPTAAPGWRPYHYGRWSSVPAYGWTWIGIDPWSYPTHHYGRWGYAHNAWFWIPGRTWGAAWVSWGAAPNYVSWCPLGFNNRPVFALSVTSYDTWHQGGGEWFGWTVVPRSHFGGRGYYANRYAVEPRSLPSDTPFIVSSRPPANLPHQRGRESAGGSRPSSVASRPLSVESRQPAAGAIPRREYGNGQPVAASRDSAFGSQPANSDRIARPRADYGAPRLYRPAEAPAAPDTSRQPTTGFGAPRRAYPIQAPSYGGAQGGRDAFERPRATAPEQQRIYPHGVPRSAPASPVVTPASPITVPEYRSPGARVPDAQPQRWRPSYGAPSAGAAPVQRVPSPAATAAPIRTQPAPAAPPPPPQAAAGASSAAGSRRPR